MKEGSPHPRTKLSLPLHTKLEGRRLDNEPRILQGTSAPRLQVWFTLEVFSGVFVTSSNSNNLQMTRDEALI